MSAISPTLVPSSPTIESTPLEPRPSWIKSWLPWLSWVPTSSEKLREAEEKFLSYVNTKSEGFYVNIGPVIEGGQDCRIWTRKFGDSPGSGPPLVMIHGMGAGLAMFSLNIDSLAKDRTIYALDLPGFGRSSRVSFGNKPEDVKERLVTALERWREGMGLEKICLLGHSFGGFLVANFSLRYPANVERLILADPWGMVGKPADVVERLPGPLIFRAFFSVVKNFNPLGALRASGPVGPWIFRRARADIMNKYVDLVGEEDKSLVSDYLFHCNGHKPEGESAFSQLAEDFFWAKDPLLEKLDINTQGLLPNTTLLLGEISWIGRGQEDRFKELAKKLGFKLEVIEGAGHHLYADNPIDFNIAVHEALGST